MKVRDDYRSIAAWLKVRAFRPGKRFAKFFGELHLMKHIVFMIMYPAGGINLVNVFWGFVVLF